MFVVFANGPPRLDGETPADRRPYLDPNACVFKLASGVCVCVCVRALVFRANFIKMSTLDDVENDDDNDCEHFAHNI